MVHDDADLTSIVRDTCVPLRVREAGREPGKGAGPLLEPIGKGVRAVAYQVPEVSPCRLTSSRTFCARSI